MAKIIIGFRYERIKEKFLKLDKDDMTLEPNEAIDAFIRYPFKKFIVPKKFRKQFLMNYGYV